MMNVQRLRLPILVGVCVWIAVRCGVADDKPEAEAPKPKVQILASPAILPKGVMCKLTTRSINISNGAEQSTFFEGRIIEASDKGVRLTTTLRGGSTVKSTSVASEISLLLRDFMTKEFGADPLDQLERVWFPVEKIGSIEIIDHPLVEGLPHGRAMTRTQPRPIGCGNSDAVVGRNGCVLCTNHSKAFERRVEVRFRLASPVRQLDSGEGRSSLSRC